MGGGWWVVGGGQIGYCEVAELADRSSFIDLSGYV